MLNTLPVARDCSNTYQERQEIVHGDDGQNHHVHLKPRHTSNAGRNICDFTLGEHRELYALMVFDAARWGGRRRRHPERRAWGRGRWMLACKSAKRVKHTQRTICRACRSGIDQARHESRWSGGVSHSTSTGLNKNSDGGNIPATARYGPKISGRRCPSTG